jgi:hypothetical protein
MGETATTECPWCGEPLEVWVERDEDGTVVQDCDVCCRPCVLHIEWSREGARVVAQRE